MEKKEPNQKKKITAEIKANDHEISRTGQNEKSKKDETKEKRMTDEESRRDTRENKREDKRNEESRLSGFCGAFVT